jgi:hypothetical protein
MTLSHEELFLSGVQNTADTVSAGVFAPGISGMPILDSISKSFDRYELLTLKLFWRPSCGTVQPGAVIMGVDYDPEEKATSSLAKVQALFPRYRGAVWTEGTLVVPSNRLMSRKFLLVGNAAGAKTNADYAALQVILGITKGDKNGVTLGEIWCQYTVRLHSPTAEHA